MIEHGKIVVLRSGESETSELAIMEMLSNDDGGTRDAAFNELISGIDFEEIGYLWTDGKTVVGERDEFLGALLEGDLLAYRSGDGFSRYTGSDAPYEHNRPTNDDDIPDSGDVVLSDGPLGNEDEDDDDQVP